MNIVQIGTCNANDDLTRLIGKSQPNKLILIEPLSIHNDNIKKCYNWVINLSIENIVISTKSEKIKFYYHDDNLELASTDTNHIIKHNKTYENNIQSIEIYSMNINELFEKYELKEIDILFIDAEGMDDTIIKNIDFQKYSIKNIYFENLHIKNDDVYDYLKDKGYFIIKNVGEYGWLDLATINNETITYNFDNNFGYVQINSTNKLYKVQFLNDNNLVYETKLHSNCWAASNKVTNYIKIYNNNMLIFEKSTKNTDKFDFNFDNDLGFVEISNPRVNLIRNYKVQFFYNTEIVYETNLTLNCWSQCSKETNCIKIYDNDILIFEKFK